MNRIDQRFEELRAANRAGLIPFVTVGDPDPAWTPAILHALVAAGADLLELGVPFSDPMADGPVIQRAGDRALAKGVGLKRVLEIAAAFRERDQVTPIVLMGYLNPIEIYGYERFCRDAHAAGVDGVLLVDAPIEESDGFATLFVEHGLAQILLAAPTTAPARITRIAAAARGFLYYVSFAGITGADRLTLDDVAAHVAELRRSTSTPIAVGFGIKDPEQAASVAGFADAVVIGSALVETLSAAPDEGAAVHLAREFLAPIRTALDRARELRPLSC